MNVLSKSRLVTVALTVVVLSAAYRLGAKDMIEGREKLFGIF